LIDNEEIKSSVDRIMNSIYIKDFLNNKLDPKEPIERASYYLRVIIELALEGSFAEQLIPSAGNYTSVYKIELDKIEELNDLIKQINIKANSLNPITKFKLNIVNYEMPNLLSELSGRIQNIQELYEGKRGKEKNFLLDRFLYGARKIGEKLELTNKELKPWEIDFVYECVNCLPEPHGEISRESVARSIKRLDLKQTKPDDYL